MKLSILSALLASTCMAIAQTQNTVVTVYPTGKFPDDLYAIRIAIKQSSNILLKATNQKGKPTAFNFSTDIKDQGQLRITKDLTLTGERVHSSQSTIFGGRVPILVQSSGEIRVDGICFDSPIAGGIFLGKSTRAEITNNVIRHVKVIPGQEQGQYFGIGAFGMNVKGALVITGNTIDTVEPVGGYGILVSTTDGDIEISHNTVKGIQTNGILVGYPTHDALIYQNRVSPGIGKYPDSIGNGILLGHASGGHFQVLENVIKIEDVNGDGIAVVGNEKAPTLDSVIAANDVTMIGSASSAIGLYGAVSHCTTYGNRIKGTSAFAFQIFALPPHDTGDAVGNIYMNNRLDGFTATNCTLSLDASAVSTHFIGRGLNYIDKGKNNSVIGLKRKR